MGGNPCIVFFFVGKSKDMLVIICIQVVCCTGKKQPRKAGHIENSKSKFKRANQVGSEKVKVKGSTLQIHNPNSCILVEEIFWGLGRCMNNKRKKQRCLKFSYYLKKKRQK